MDGMRFVVSWHVHGTLAADAIFRYKLPCDATLIRVDTCGTANVTSALKIGTLLPTSDDDGIIKSFTGISDPYEEPEKPEMRIDTTELTPDLAAHRIIVKLESLGFIR